MRRSSRAGSPGSRGGSCVRRATSRSCASAGSAATRRTRRSCGGPTTAARSFSLTRSSTAGSFCASRSATPVRPRRTWRWRGTSCAAKPCASCATRAIPGSARLPSILRVRLVCIGLAAGLFSALFGVGGGLVIVPLLIGLAAFGTREATATSLAAIAIAALAGAILYAVHGAIDPGYAALVGVPAMAGVLIGTAMQQRLSSRVLTLSFAVFLAGVGVWLLAG
ncbi:MAG: sulfite exporter TauE/SafE family protein [Thermoleophilia bacterium]|nr:sulfite exporter TauE/SafE family protein [Thermoleophilia bacterium]